jgi:hypothetical protein
LNPKALQELINNLRVFYRCPSCSAEYKSDDIRFLGKVEEHCFMQLNCKKCSLPVLATVLLSSDLTKPKKNRRKEHTRVSLGTDASRKERSAFQKKGAITAGEIADFYAFLQTDKGLI